MSEPLSHEELLDLVAAYALGVLPSGEHAQVAAFLLADPDARREFEELRATANFIGLAAEEPVDSARSARMKERLMTTVRNDAQPRTGPTSLAMRRRTLLVTGLAAAAAIVLAVFSQTQNLSLRSSLAETQAHVTTLQDEIKRSNLASERDQHMLADLAASDAKRYPVTYGTVVTRGSHVYLAFSSLPALPKGKVYQAWTLAKSAKVMAPSVTFTPTANGTTLVPIPNDATKLTIVALSVEPEGGSRQPTTKPTFVQPLS